MRLLVACPKCQRQYDATGRPIGSRFHCRCGEPLTIQQPPGHDSAVVRCASCGAPRQGDQQQCGFCGADFTLREQDLETICPHCFARLGDHAKFCDHCGHALAAEPVPLDDTPLICPACQATHRLSSRQVAGYAVLECKICGGFWLSNDVLQHLIDRAGKIAERTDERRREELARKQASSPLESQPGESKHHGYLPCPVCHDLMVHQNFGHRSGVVIDICKHDGVWFDANKLPRLLDWVKAGGLMSAGKEQQIAHELANNIDHRIQALAIKDMTEDNRFSELRHESTPWHWVEQVLVGVLGDLFTGRRW